MQPEQRGGASAVGAAVKVNGVVDLLPFLRGVPVTYRFIKHNATLEGFVAERGYACACDSSCGYRRDGKALSAVEFEKHAGAKSKNQNGHIFLPNGTSLYGLFHALREVVDESFAAAFFEAAGVPMTVPAAAATWPPLAQGQPPNRETELLQASDVTMEQPAWAVQMQGDLNFEITSEEANAGLSLLDLRGNSPATEGEPMQVEGIEWPSMEHSLSLIDAAEQIENAARGDHEMPDVLQVRITAGDQPRDIGLFTATHLKVMETKYQPVRTSETKYKPESLLKDVRGLLSTGLLEGFRVTYKKNGVEMTGRIDGQRYSCGCMECDYSNIMNACEFEQHAGQSTNNQNDHIFLDSGISLYKLIQVLKYKRLDLLGDLIEEQTGLAPNLIEYGKWKASFQVENNGFVDAPSHTCSTQSLQELSAGVTSHGTLATTSVNSLKKSASNHISNLSWNAFRRPRWQYKRASTQTSAPTLSKSPEKGTSGLSTCTSTKSVTVEIPSENIADPLSSEDIKPNFAADAAVISTSSECDPVDLAFALSSPVSIVQEPPLSHHMDSKTKEPRRTKVRDNSLHPLVFKEGGLPDLTLLTYKLKHGEVLKQGYKRGAGIVCDCCNQELTPSQFEDHAGMGKRRQPYRNIYTLEGLTLHELALKLQNSLNSNGVSSVDFSDIDDPHNIATSGCRKEPSSTSRPPIVPLKRTLQGRVVDTESCHLCGNTCTTIGQIREDMLIFCNQCERPCHVKCYNSGLQENNEPLNVLREYMQCHFFCCKKCQLLRASLHQELNKREKIRHRRSNVCWHLLSGMNPRRDVQQYIDQVTGIFKVAFPDTAAQETDIIRDMVIAADVGGKNDFRGIYCAVLTTSSKLVVSAAILKVGTEEVAELVLVATHNECRKKGYFRLLLRQIESHLTALNVQLLTAPVDPEMVPIWSKKLGFTILSDQEKSSLLEAHPLVMFEGLTLMQKSLAMKPDLEVLSNEVTMGEPSAQTL
ncbi:hypothetical protein ZWY2020_008277 [Hordeum vulgare]|nr:hypothetical protein ZWY2020_008277 [Hordeum vulgare]